MAAKKPMEDKIQKWPTKNALGRRIVRTDYKQQQLLVAEHSEMELSVYFTSVIYDTVFWKGCDRQKRAQWRQRKRKYNHDNTGFTSKHAESRVDASVKTVNYSLHNM